MKKTDRKHSGRKPTAVDDPKIKITPDTVEKWLK